MADDAKHMLKTGKRGRPFAKDTHDLFATLIVSLNLQTHTRFFRSYPYTFTTDDAANNLASLRFSQSNRQPDPNDPSHIVTTTTTTTFSMNRAVAKTICQYFMDARLISSAIDPNSTSFRDRGIFSITPKGLHILERFITKNGIASDRLVGLFASQPICPKLLNLERRASDDELFLTPLVTDLIFRRFAGGNRPNYVTEPITSLNPQALSSSASVRPYLESPKYPEHYDRSNGIDLQDLVERTKDIKNFLAESPVASSAASSTSANSNLAASGNLPYTLTRRVFHSQAAVDWIADYSTVQTRDEASEILAYFVAARYISLYTDRTRVGDRVTRTIPAFEVRTLHGQPLDQPPEYYSGPRILYRITERGRKVLEGNASSYNNPTAITNTSATVSAPTTTTPGPGIPGSGQMITNAQQQPQQQSQPQPQQQQQQQQQPQQQQQQGPGSSSGSRSSERSKSTDGGSSQHSVSNNNNNIDDDTASATYYFGNAALSDAVDSHLSNTSTAALHEFLRSQDWSKDSSSTARLKAILDEPALRALFRDFLRANYCEENLGFWLDVAEIRRRFATTSTSTASSSSSTSTGIGAGIGTGSFTVTPASKNKNNNNNNNANNNSNNNNNNNNNNESDLKEGHESAMQQHQRYLVNAAMAIYHTYLAPQSPNELNIDHNLRADVINFIAKVEGEETNRGGGKKNGKPSSSAGGGLGSGLNSSFRATQIQTLLRYYERIQAHIFRLMATDQVPRFTRTPRFLELMDQHSKGSSPSFGES